MITFQRNGTLDEVSTIYTGHNGMENFGLLNRVNGMEELPFWKGSCNSIKASEGKYTIIRENMKILAKIFRKLLAVTTIGLQLTNK